MLKRKIFGSLVQLYVTGKCGMGCDHCSSRGIAMDDINMETFESAVKFLTGQGVERIELFANDPLLHPEVFTFIEVMEKSALNSWGLLTVGRGRTDQQIEERFLSILPKIAKGKGSVVLSVDYARETAERLLVEDQTNSYAFKAKVFWDFARYFKNMGVRVRINTVASRHNVDEVPEIIREVVAYGFASSFCFTQNRDPMFDRLAQNGFDTETEKNFREFLMRSRILTVTEIEHVLDRAYAIVRNGELESRPGFASPFNRFRGKDRTEGNIPEKLVWLRNQLMQLKSLYPDKILPSPEFIHGFGNRGFGCLKLLRQGVFPQIKIGSNGQIFFCCDMHDPLTGEFNIHNLRQSGYTEKLAEAIRTNPYVWLCADFNACDFSVNHVQYSASSAERR